jgi:hypothetical protein
MPSVPVLAVRWIILALAGLPAAALAQPAEPVQAPVPVPAPPDQGDHLPRQDPAKPIRCLEDGDGRLWRVQCVVSEDGKDKLCLYAPDALVDEQGTFGGDLERVAPCPLEGKFDQAALRAEGWRLERSIADAPIGWERDARGRVYQVNFDLHNRLYLGVSWQPTLVTGLPEGSESELGRMGMDFGVLELEVYASGRSATRHRVAVLRGEVQLAPFAADVVALHYDVSHRREKPLLRLVTFFGTPRRHDVNANLGAWVELGHLTLRENAAGQHEGLLRVATAHLTWDLWRSSDMYSYVRVRGGLGYERTFVDRDWVNERDALTPGAAVDASISFDHRGYNHLSFTGSWERPLGLREENDGVLGDRVRLALGFERIVISLNDQPLTLRVGVEADHRSDLPEADRPAGWDLRGIVGLRFNLWAPGR